MKSSWIPTLVIRQNISQFLCLVLLGITTLSVENAPKRLSASNSRHLFPKESTEQHHRDSRNQFPSQRRGSGTH
ncbi:MAG: hypothetical protein F6K11_15620 [Leptolyngbya sp. SIO3F4]|nr:hypothetical protein [Leptolyngbya sp. SIO3F4]